MMNLRAFLGLSLGFLRLREDFQGSIQIGIFQRVFLCFTNVFDTFWSHLPF